jgi:hypothetical protein
MPNLKMYSVPLQYQVKVDRQNFTFIRAVIDVETATTWVQCYITFYGHSLLMFLISWRACSWQVFSAMSLP